MSDHHHETTEPLHHHHECCNLFGCGDEKGTGVLREDIKDAAFDNGDPPTACCTWTRSTRRDWTHTCRRAAARAAN